MKDVTIVSLGIGIDKYLTFGAAEALQKADVVFVMAHPGSWMINFAMKHAVNARLRPYYPKNVNWAKWQNDPILDIVVDEMSSLQQEGLSVVLALAGDCSIFGNFGFLEERFRAKKITWEVIPGISFFNALPIFLKKVLVNEGGTLVLTSVTWAEELQPYLNKNTTIILYCPQQIEGLMDFIVENKIPYAKSVIINIGKNANTAQIIDLTRPSSSQPQGLVILSYKIGSGNENQGF